MIYRLALAVGVAVARAVARLDGVSKVRSADNPAMNQTMNCSSLRGAVLVLWAFFCCVGLFGSDEPAAGGEQFNGVIAQSGAQEKPAPDAWRLVRTPDPAGGRDAVSITRTADISKSDLEFAGLMLRCGERSVEVLIVLVRALPPRTHPKVKVTAGSASAEFVARVVPPDVLLSLPPEATALASGPWQAATELAVTVEDEQGAIRGAVPLSGLGHALALLRSNCAAQ